MEGFVDDRHETNLQEIDRTLPGKMGVEVLELDANDLFEKILAYSRAEAMILALCSSVMAKDE